MMCVSILSIIGSDNGLSPGRRQAIIWSNAEILLIGPVATNLSEIVIEIQTFSFTKKHLKISSEKVRTMWQCVKINCRRLELVNACVLTSTKNYLMQLLTHYLISD